MLNKMAANEGNIEQSRSARALHMDLLHGMRVWKINFISGRQYLWWMTTKIQGGKYSALNIRKIYLHKTGKIAFPSAFCFLSVYMVYLDSVSNSTSHICNSRSLIWIWKEQKLLTEIVSVLLVHALPTNKTSCLARSEFNEYENENKTSH